MPSRRRSPTRSSSPEHIIPSVFHTGVAPAVAEGLRRGRPGGRRLSQLTVLGREREEARPRGPGPFLWSGPASIR